MSSHELDEKTWEERNEQANAINIQKYDEIFDRVFNLGKKRGIVIGIMVCTIINIIFTFIINYFF